MRAFTSLAENVHQADKTNAQLPHPSRYPRNGQKCRFEDLRVAKSYHALSKAFLDLLKSSSLEQIAITGIADKAGVSVPVFYRQFASKEALLADIAGDETRFVLDHIRSAIVSSDNARALQDLCALIDGKRELWKLLLTQGAATSMRNEFTRLVSGMNLNPEMFRADMPPALAVTFVVHGVFDVLAWWLDQGPNYPVSTIVRALQDLVLGPAAAGIDYNLIEGAFASQPPSATPNMSGAARNTRRA